MKRKCVKEIKRDLTCMNEICWIIINSWQREIEYLASWRVHWQQNENKGWVIKKIQKVGLLNRRRRWETTWYSRSYSKGIIDNKLKAKVELLKKFQNVGLLAGNGK